MKKKYFVVSDVHGCYYSLIDALENKGFNWDNDGHILVVAGDWCDRGPHSGFLYRLFVERGPRKIRVLKGNHEEMLSDRILELNKSSFRAARIGRFMLEEGADRERLEAQYEEEMAYFDSTVANCDTIPTMPVNEIGLNEVKAWIDTLSYYMETETHIITHSTLPKVKDWRNATDAEWSEAVWDRDLSAAATAGPDGKVLVSGHTATSYLREQLYSKNSKDLSILSLADGKRVHIDGAAYCESGVVNVYMFEEDDCVE